MNGVIAWFTRNGVAANCLMVLILAGGLYSLYFRSTLEVFPEFELDIISVTMSYRGATPRETEEGIVVKIEEAIQDLEGIDELESSASEGTGRVQIEVADGFEARELLDDVKNRIDAITTFPSETERPVYSILARKRQVINLVISGDIGEHALRKLGEQTRDDILGLSTISQVDLQEVRPYEISIEVSEYTLEKYDLTFAEVAEAVRRSSVDLPAGNIKTSGGEILLRTKGQAYTSDDFGNIVVRTTQDGVHLTLAEIATIRDDFEEEPVIATFNGTPCVVLEVYRVGEQNARAITDAVKEYIADSANRLPAGVKMDYWRDRSKVLEARMNTLIRSALQGGILVILLLTLFLRMSVAVWVALGIPICFAGTFAAMPMIGVTFNVVSMFAFILVLGIVVDDAIVTGENIFVRLKEGGDPTEAAILGTKEVAVPVTFGVLTTIIAFIPLAMVGGMRGKIFAQIPLIVIPVLLFSLIESKLILPAHLKHVRINADSEGPLTRLQGRIADGFMWFVHNVYQPVLDLALRLRYIALSIFVGGSIVLLSLVFSGYVQWSFFPRIPSETASASLTMPQGTPFDLTNRYIDRMREAAEGLREKYRDDSGKSVVRNILATAGSSGNDRGQSHIGRVSFQLEPPEVRTIDITSQKMVQEWRQAIGNLPGVQELNFRAEFGRGGDPIDIRLAGDNFETLAATADIAKTHLATYDHVFAITDTYQDGKEEIKLRIKPEAELLGLTMIDLAQQARQAFFGAEAQRIQRGRDDVRVMVRYPKNERDSVGYLERMKIRAPSGAAVPFSEVAEAEMSRGFATIRRVDRKRVINVRADADKTKADISGILTSTGKYLDDAIKEFRGVRYSFEGEEKERRESMLKIRWGLVAVLFAIYGMLAIPLRSYVQPLIAMSVIPFGLMGAIIGHIIMGMSLSIFSMFGMLALIGVVINDSLVMIDFINRYRRDGHTLFEAVSAAGARRFRAIVLTSLTTFVGLAPLLFDKSTHVKFLLPMAVSLGFGILFATAVTLFLVPVMYLIVNDLVRGAKYCWGVEENDGTHTT